MKKLIFSAAMLIAAGFSMNAQDVKFGVKAGFNLASFSGDAVDISPVAGFHAGGLAEFKFGNFALQPELLYTTAGAQRTNESVFEADMKSTLSYIAVPVAAKYYILEGLSIQAGPQFAFLLSAKDEYRGGGMDGEVDSKDSYSSYDLGILGGLGYELESGLLFSARYVQGISNAAEVESGDDYKLHNTSVQFSIGYKF